MANIISKLPSEHEKLLLRAYQDLIFFGKIFLPGDFRKSTSPPFHYEIAEELLRPTNKPVCIAVARGHGKYLRLDQPVLTERGWVNVGDLLPGDTVYGSDGKPKKLVTLSETLYKDDMYLVETRDGRRLIVSGDHLWTVRVLNGAHGNPWRVMTTEQMARNYFTERIDKRYNREYLAFNYAVPVPGPIEMPEKDLPLDPYTLGLLIGDGSLHGMPRLTCGDGDVDEVAKYIPYSTSVRRYKKRAPAIYIHGIKRAIDVLGLSEKRSWEKFIPPEYLNASIEQRLELLRGLMDTDGTTSSPKSKGIMLYYCTTSERLADDVVYLVRSLGGIAHKYRHENDYRGYWNISINMRLNPFKLKRKSKLFKPHNKNYVAITKIERIDGAFARCLKVDSDDELFVANDFILTHNTSLMKALILHRLVFAKKAHEWGFTDKPKNEFIAWVSANQKKSQNNMEYVKLHLEYNDRINFYFAPDGKPNLRGDTWNVEDIRTAYGDRMITTSNLASVRGDTLATIHSGSIRYSLVVADDVEHEENTKTPAARDRIVKTIMDGILPAIDQHDPGNRLIVVGTPVHYDSFIQRMIDEYNKIKDDEEAIKNHPWRIFVYSAFQPDMPGGVLWSEWMPMEKLEEIKAQYAHSPKGVGGFYQEYALEVQSSETALWTRDHLRYWSGYYKKVGEDDVLVIDGQYVPVNTFLGCDPATDIETKHSDYSVVMVIGVDPSNNIYVLDYVRLRGIPTLGLRDENGEIIGKKGVVDYIIEMYDRYNCRHGTVEDVPMNRSIFQSLNAEKRRLNRYDINIIPEKPGGTEKHNRIYSELNSRFAAAAIHVKENQFDLIDEILKFGPKMAHDDTIDALYYACKHAYPPKLGIDETTGEVTISKARRKAVPWILA